MSHSRNILLLILALLGSQVSAQKFYFSFGLGPGTGIEKDLHKDYYDLGEMVYEHVPILGFIIRKIKGKLAK